MEIKRKCSSKEHNEEAISYCGKCEIYMCNKCEKIHSGLCINHELIILNNNVIDIFTGFCEEENHSMKLEYFCRNHNKLCCPACLCKIKSKGNGQHNNCNVCNIEDIKNEKKNKLKENINE